MEQLLIVLAVLLFVVFPLWAVIRIVSLGRQNNAIAEKLHEMEREIDVLRSSQHDARTALQAAPAPVPPVAATPLPSIPKPVAASAKSAPAVTEPLETRSPASAPVAATSAPSSAAPSPLAPRLAAVPPPPLPPEMPPPVATSRGKINWERFMGANLFAWIGGIAAFLAVAFFVKYSFEHNLIPPEVRVAIGFVFGLALIVGGLKVPRVRHATTADTLIATGVVTLYAVTFACNSIYHFAFFGPVATFAVMSLITAAAFVLAVRLDARAVAVLGMLGGFVTPKLLSTGQDNPTGLFVYIALLDVGLIAVTLHRRWNFLVPLAALGTLIMEAGWAATFLNASKTLVPVIVAPAFAILFVGALIVAKKRDRFSSDYTLAAAGLAVVSLGFAAVLLGYPISFTRPGAWLLLVLLADLCLLAIAWLDESSAKFHLIAGMLTFAVLTGWTTTTVTNALLPWALGAYLVYAGLHTAFPLVLERHRPSAAPTWWSQLFPPLTLLLLLEPMFKLDGLSLAFWPCVLIVDLLAIGLAVLSASLLSVAAILVLTLLATGVWLFQIPVSYDGSAALLLVVGGFALLFFAATLILGRRLPDAASAADERLAALFGNRRSQLPAFSALLPFVLLVMMTQRLQLANPSPVFGLALLLTILTLGLAVLMELPWLPACALAGVSALEYAWTGRHFANAIPTTALLWHLFFYASFTAFPFVFRSRFARMTGPWAMAALAGVAHFPLVYELVKNQWPNHYLGLLPALFAVPPLVSLFWVARSEATEPRARLNQLAWFGGIALLFITLIFPIQFERQWLTIAWALEGAALLWLYQRVPHRGLQGVGVVLLLIAFARLALNPAVLDYHARGQTPLLNWYLYTYGLLAAALLVGAKLAAAPRHQCFGVNLPPLFQGMATVALFLLLNIEIADFFTPPGDASLTFQFSGNFARDMTYTIAWSVFALALLIVSLRKALPVGRYAALGLLSVAVLKLFFHDLARLDSLYRVGALFGVAVIAILASVAYQRLLPNDEKPAEN